MLYFLQKSTRMMFNIYNLYWQWFSLLTYPVGTAPAVHTRASATSKLPPFLNFEF